ncbi:MAG: hypothetical protein CLLPBCKN_008610 [Chroococcidiopsis cubana SAG 39.79]|nr:hypothetical protein [Chroococcidiopsis cubana SAG 39.79]
MAIIESTNSKSNLTKFILNLRNSEKSAPINQINISAEIDTSLFVDREQLIEALRAGFLVLQL